MPATFVRWTAISLLSGLVQRKVFFKTGNKGMYLNLFALLIGAPGSGKTSAMRQGLDVLNELEKQIEILSHGLQFNYRLTQATPAAMIQKMCRSKQILSNGPHTIIQSPVYIYAEEAGTFLKDLGGGDSIQELLNLFDCPDFFNKETRAFGSEYIEQPYVSLLGGTTPDYFNKFMNSEATGQGLSARFIFAYVTDDEETKYNYGAQTDPLLFHQLVEMAKRIALTKGVIQDLPECEPITTQFSDSFDLARREAPNGHYNKHYLARKFLMVRKVAGLLALSEGGSLRVKPEHYMLANAYLSELEPKFALMFKMKGLDKKNINETLHNILTTSRVIYLDNVISQLYAAGNVVDASTEYIRQLLETSVSNNVLERKTIDGREAYVRR